MSAVRAVALLCAMMLASCVSQSMPAGPREFARWLAADAARGQAFQRFEAMLAREGVADVIPARELWLSDLAAQECVIEPFVMPPEEFWPRIAAFMRSIFIPSIAP